MRAIVGSVIHLVVTPVILLVYGFTPLGVVGELVRPQTPLERVQSLVVLGLWFVWTWGIWSLISVVVNRRFAGEKSVSRVIAPHVALAAASLISALSGTRSTDSSSVLGDSRMTNQLVVSVDDSATVSRGERIALGVLAGVMLQVFFHNQAELVRQARRGDTYARHSRLVQIAMQRLIGLQEQSGVRVPVQRIGDVPEAVSPCSPAIPLGFGDEGCVSIPLRSGIRMIVDGDIDISGHLQYLTGAINYFGMPRTWSVVAQPGPDSTCIEIWECTGSPPTKHNAAEYRLRSECASSRVHLEPDAISFTLFTSNPLQDKELSELSQCVMQTRSTTKGQEIADVSDTQADLVIRILGPLEVLTPDGRTVQFRKSKSAELLAWLVLHRDRPSREIARTAMWDTNIQDSTFNNVVSELRRALRSANPSLDLRETRHQRFIEVPDSIQTDADLLENAWITARRDETDEAWSEVFRLLQFVRGLPFESTKFEWADSEGLTSHFMLKVMNICADLADHFFVKEDVRSVFRVTELGLRALPGSEEMLEWRKKALELPTTVLS